MYLPLKTFWAEQEPMLLTRPCSNSTGCCGRKQGPQKQHWARSSGQQFAPFPTVGHPF